MIELILGIIILYLIVQFLIWLWEIIVIIFPYVLGILILGGSVYLFILIAPGLIKLIGYLFGLVWIVLKFFMIIVQKLVTLFFSLIINALTLMFNWLWAIMIMSVPIFQALFFQADSNIVIIFPLLCVIIGLISIGLKRPSNKQL
jgi:hypothetical protein